MKINRRRGDVSAKIVDFMPRQPPTKTVRVDVLYFHPDEVGFYVHDTDTMENNYKLAEALRVVADGLEGKKP